ncbi:Hypp5637 [Branchiostoma lanceolatum]|uniref:Hypp5637 protein n=1 Tax=Branchiostoma lanceolatum TaxID=7740 RepID=A0A8J9VEP0_BRALA|nr:Hypp5637 [Branchiostoma lanceolatum]
MSRHPAAIQTCMLLPRPPRRCETVCPRGLWPTAVQRSVVQRASGESCGFSGVFSALFWGCAFVQSPGFLQRDIGRASPYAFHG